jgi:hypothetical protein
MANATSVQAPKGQYLSQDLIRKVAPSVFAVEPWHTVSDKYTFIPSIDIILGLFKEGFLPVYAAQSRSRIEGKSEFTKHLIRFRHRNDVAATAVVGETVRELTFINSHDTTSLYDLGGGVFRFVCSNGMMVPDSLMQGIKVMHRGNILDNVIQGSYRILEDLKVIDGAMDEMKATVLSRPEQLLLSESALAVRWGRDKDTNNLLAPITPERALNSNRYADNGNDAWKTFNRLQENLTKGGQAGRNTAGNRTTTRAVNGIDSLVGINKELWSLTQAMVELKKMAV